MSLLDTVLGTRSILTTIFSYLTFNDQQATTTLTKAWRKATIPLFWREIKEDHYSLVHFEHLITKYCSHIEHFYVFDPDNELTQTEADETIELCPSLQSLTIDDMRRSSMVKRLIQKAAAERGDSITHLSLKHLNFEEDAKRNPKQLAKTIRAITDAISTLRNLKRLDIETVDMSARELEVLIESLTTKSLIAVTIDISEPPTAKSLDSIIERFGDNLVLLSVDKIIDDVAQVLDKSWGCKLHALHTLRLGFFLTRSVSPFARLNPQEHLPNMRMLSVREDHDEPQLHDLWAARAHWPNVSRLEVDCLWLHDEAAASIANAFPKLRELRLTHPSVLSDRALAGILDAHLPHLYELHVVGTGVDLASAWDQSISVVLRDLMLSAVQITPQVLSAAFSSEKLTGIDLDGAIFDEDPIEFWDCVEKRNTKIEAIGLANNARVGDEIIDKVVELWGPSLRWIDVEGTQVSQMKMTEVRERYPRIEFGVNDDDDDDDGDGGY